MTRQRGSIKSFEKTYIIDSAASDEVGVLKINRAVCRRIWFPGPFSVLWADSGNYRSKTEKGSGEPGGAASI
jgi:hypothetical protein